MSRKVDVNVVAEVTVKVRVKIPMTFVADDGANLDRAVKMALKAERVNDADLQDALTPEVLGVDGFDQDDDYTSVGDWLQEAVQTAVTDGKNVKYIDATVTDSR